MHHTLRGAWVFVYDRNPCCPLDLSDCFSLRLHCQKLLDLIISFVGCCVNITLHPLIITVFPILHAIPEVHSVYKTGGRTWELAGLNPKQKIHTEGRILKVRSSVKGAFDAVVYVMDIKQSLSKNIVILNPPFFFSLQCDTC